MQIQKIEHFNSNQTIVAAIEEIISDSYATGGYHLRSDILKCETIYTTGNEEDGMIGFFMVHYHQQEGQSFCYMGLSACKNHYKSHGLIKQLYLRFLSDCQEHEINLDQPIICYATTASPLVFKTVEKMFRQVDPKPEGSYSSEAGQMASQLVKSYYTRATPRPDNPFILYNAVAETRYSQAETERQAAIAKELNLPIFDTYGIKETNGDRILMICRV